MYWPGVLKVAVVVALPEKGIPGRPPLRVSASGRMLENVTSAGPRNSDHRNVTGFDRLRGGAPEDVVSFASSETQAVRDNGVLALAVRSTINVDGPCPVGPFSSNRTTGGVLPTAASINGEIS